MNERVEQACFGAGCFWGVQHSFAKIKGVVDTIVGYCGGKLDNPSYELVCTGATNHAEVCKLAFDRERVSYPQLLEALWDMHDPTTLNRQGPDRGTQYRSVIFYYDEAQRLAAERSKAEHAGRWSRPIVTEIVPMSVFWPAESYHQHYLSR